jgi:hypothetical protein
VLRPNSHHAVPCSTTDRPDHKWLRRTKTVQIQRSTQPCPYHLVEGLVESSHDHIVVGLFVIRGTAVASRVFVFRRKYPIPINAATIRWHTSKPKVSADTVPDIFPCAGICISSKPKCYESCVVDPRPKEPDSESSAIGKPSL